MADETAPASAPMPGLPSEEPTFGSWSARAFRGPKAVGEILAATRAHEDYLTILSLDQSVGEIAAADPGGLGPLSSGAPDFLVTGVDGRERLVHVVDAPLDAAVKAGLADAYAEAGRRGLAYEVVGLDWIHDQPRLLNARLVAGCRKVRVSPDDRVRILQFLTESGTTTLQEVAAVVAAPERVSSVLAMVLEGTVWVDLRRTLGPEMPVRRLRVASDDEQPDEA